MILPPAATTPELDAAGHAVLQKVLLQLRAAIGARPLQILIDPLLGDPLAEHPHTQESLRAGKALRQALPHIHADIDPTRGPYLIHIPSEADAERLVNASVELAWREATGNMPSGHRGRCVCAWICDEPEPEATALRLARCGSVIAPQGKPHPFRYWDPRVIWHLPRVLPAGHWHSLRARLGKWCHLSSTGELVQLPALASGHADSSGEPHERLRFDESAWARLKDITLCNKVLALCPQWGIALSESLPQQVEQAIQSCRSHGFDTEQDILVYCACALTAHPQFDRHPAVSAAIEDARANGASLLHALQGFDNNFWQQLSTSRQGHHP